MKRLSLLVVSLFITSCAESTSSPPPTPPVNQQVITAPPSNSIAPDRIAADPASAEVLLENDCVRVQFHNVAVGQTIPMHSHPKYVIYVFNSYKARNILADGSQRIGERKAGEVIWNEAVSHSIENIGTTDIRNLVVEIKSSPRCQ
jgi:hypothetical protein